jgi:hypothetical protein
MARQLNAELRFDFSRKRSKKEAFRHPRGCHYHSFFSPAKIAKVMQNS